MQKKTKIPIETSESEEEELDNNSKGDESFGSTTSLSSYNEHDDNEDYDSEENDEETEVTKEVTNKQPSPLKSVRSFTWSAEIEPSNNLELILEESEEENNIETPEDDEDSDEAFYRESVILHPAPGCCSYTKTPTQSPRPSSSDPPTNVRARLGGRSLPGRTIEDRNLTTYNRRPVSIHGRLVHTGDQIRYFTGYYNHGDLQDPQWLKAKVLRMFLTQQRLHPTYYNIENEEGVKISVELIRGGLNWQMLVEEEWQYMER